MFQYHHCRGLESIVFGEVRASPDFYDPDLKGAYSWLERGVGFCPLFLAVGTTEEDIRMTGYQNQWAKIVGTKIVGRKKDGTYVQKNILRKSGEPPNYVLFSFKDVDGIFMDYMGWHLVFYAGDKDYQMTDYEKKLIFKYSYKKSDWLRKARKNPHSVQLVTQKLYLPDAGRIWVRNQKTKNLLESKGFENVGIKRLLLGEQ